MHEKEKANLCDVTEDIFNNFLLFFFVSFSFLLMPKS